MNFKLKGGIDLIGNKERDRISVSSQKNIPFRTMSSQRLFWLSVLSVGFYDIYWFYKNWVAIRDAAELKIRPGWRGWFGGLFIYALFEHISENAKAQQIQPTQKLKVWANFYFIVIIVSHVWNEMDFFIL